jgi:transketolase
LTEGADAAIVACGNMVAQALAAGESLRAKGIKARVINMHTVKPLDEDAVIEAGKATKGILPQEHSVIGGLVTTAGLSEKHPPKFYA